MIFTIIAMQLALHGLFGPVCNRVESYPKPIRLCLDFPALFKTLTFYDTFWPAQNP